MNGIPKLVAKSGATALALALLAGNAGAAAYCARPQEVTALRVAALRQQLMVAALTCHQAGSFNRFVTSYQSAFQDSDRTLTEFFLHKDGGNGDAAYNAYKTRQANDASLRSLSDPGFCGEAAYVFRAALSQEPSLAELVSQDGPLIHTGYQGCTRNDTELADAAAGAPALPARHRAMLDGAPPAPTPVSAPQASPSIPAAHAGIANVPPAGPAANPPPPADERDAQTPPPAETDDRYADNTYDNAYAYDHQAPAMNSYAQNSYAQAAPAPYSPYAGSWYGYQPMRQVQGPDGRWYLMPAP